MHMQLQIPAVLALKLKLKLLALALKLNLNEYLFAMYVYVVYSLASSIGPAGFAYNLLVAAVLLLSVSALCCVVGATT